MAIIESVEQAQLPPAIQRAASTPDAPSPWIINVSRPTKEKARRDATLATSTQLNVSRPTKEKARRDATLATSTQLNVSRQTKEKARRAATLATSTQLNVS